MLGTILGSGNIEIKFLPFLQIHIEYPLCLVLKTQKLLLTRCTYGVPAVCWELSLVLEMKINKVLFTL